MAKLEQKRFASMVRMLQTAYPRDWEKHLHNLGVTASADPPPADLDRIMERVFWMVPQAGIKNPAAWIAFDMARAEAALASVEPEAPLKVAPRRHGPPKPRRARAGQARNGPGEDLRCIATGIGDGDQRPRCQDRN